MPLVLSIKPGAAFVIEGGIRVVLDYGHGGIKAIIEAPEELRVERCNDQRPRQLDDTGRRLPVTAAQQRRPTEQGRADMPVRPIVSALLLLLGGGGCAATPPPRVHAPTWIESAQFLPASEHVPTGLPVPAGWVVHPHQLLHSVTEPYGITNEAGALISYTGTIRFDGTPGIYRVEYLGGEFGPNFYPLFDIEHTGGATETFVPVLWTQPFPFEPRLLRKELP